jgi:hypothetical protein
VRLQAAIRGIGIELLPEQVVAAPLREGSLIAFCRNGEGRRTSSTWFTRRARDVAVGQESHRLSSDSRFGLAPGEEHLGAAGFNA